MTKNQNKQQKKKGSNLEIEIMNILQKSLKTAMNKALQDIFKDWK